MTQPQFAVESLVADLVVDSTALNFLDDAQYEFVSGGGGGGDAVNGY